MVEAFAAGVPVVGSRRGAIPEFVKDGETGLLAEPGIVEQWRAAVEQLGSDAESERMGALAYAAWQERYSPERAAPALEEVYADAIASRMRGGISERTLGPAGAFH